VATAADVAAEHPDLVAAGQVVGTGVVLYPEALAPAAGTDTPESAPATTDPLSPAPARAARGVDAATVGRLARARSAVGLEQPTQALYLRAPDIAPPSGRQRAACAPCARWGLRPRTSGSPSSRSCSAPAPGPVGCTRRSSAAPTATTWWSPTRR